MPPLDTPTLVALVLLAGAAWYFLSGPKAVVGVSPLRKPAGRALIDVMEETGREAAGRHIEDRLGKQKAAEFAKSFSTAFSEEAPKPDPAQGPKP